MSGKNLDVLSIGFYVGDEYFERHSRGDRYPQVAAFKLEKRFLHAILLSGCVVNVVSTVAVSTYPKGRKIFLPKAEHNERSMRVDTVPFVNLPFVKLLSRTVSICLGLLSRKRRASLICVYSVHLPNLLSAYLYSRLKKIPFFVYIPDLPNFMAASEESILRVLLRKLNSYICEHLVSASSGIIVVTKYMPTDVAAWSQLPFLVLEGIAETPDITEHEAKQHKGGSTQVLPNTNIVFYAGGVTKKYGICELVDGFIQANIDAELWICGSGDLEGYLTVKAASDSRIKYFGFVSPDEVARLQNMATCLVITRNPAEAYTRYSFPSKLIEYMASGKPVLTTFLDGIPAEYFEYLVEIKKFSSDGVREALVRFFSHGGVDVSKAEQGRNWILRNKSALEVGANIRSFLEVNCG